MSTVAIETTTAEAMDFDAILALLAGAGLPTHDLSLESIKNFSLATQGGALVGAIALERYGDVGLLRSLVVASTRRKVGVGAALVEAAERKARGQGLSALILLTETAQDFFMHMGYAVTSRIDAPKAVQASSEFAGVCPVSATCMVKALR